MQLPKPRCSARARAMPAPSLFSLVFPTTSISPRGSPTKAKTHIRFHFHLLPFHQALASPRLHASSSSSSSAGDELHLLDKPSPSPAAEAAPPPSPEEALAPFLKFFRAKGTDPDAAPAGSYAEYAGEGAAAARACAAAGGRDVRWYDPEPGDLVAGVVVGGDERTLDVDVGTGGEPALMLAKEAVPLSGEEFGYLACDVASKDAGRFAVDGKVGIVVRFGEGEVVGGSKEKGKSAPVVGIGTMVFAEVLGRTLGGRPLLSARRLFRRVAWHRVRQIKQLNVSIEVKIFEWNSGGLLSRIEGLRAFLPKAEMMTRPRNFTALKNNVGRLMHVCITRIDERTNELIISEKVAWEMTYLQEGTLLQGTVRQLFPYGAQIMIGETNRSGLLHISNISHGQLTSIGDVLQVDEKVKVLVVKSRIPDKIALSIKDLESEPGLFLSNREKVFSEAEEMAQKYREQIPEVPGPDKLDFSCSDVVPFDSEAESYANWKWLKFRRADEVNCDFSTE